MVYRMYDLHDLPDLGLWCCLLWCWPLRHFEWDRTTLALDALQEVHQNVTQ
jgi:hypothetical protein